MPKSARWTIYVAVMIGVIGFGYYITVTKPAPDQSAAPGAAASSNVQEAGADAGVDGTSDSDHRGAPRPE
ncbi:MAG: hypothetical protein ACOC9J_01590 [Persicimonas sp.]